MKRTRGRGRRQSNPANRSYDSNGPDVRVRGTANQVFDKYQTLARDAQASGDRIAAENYLQHAEHYYRIMLSNQLVRTDISQSEDDQEVEGTDLTSIDEGSDENGDDLAGEIVEPLVLRRNGVSDDEEAHNEDEMVATSEEATRAVRPGRRRGPLRRKEPKNGPVDASDLESVVGE